MMERRKFQPKLGRSVQDNIRHIIPSIADNFFSYQDQVIARPLAKDKLHRMRISGKPLRYTMEMFQPAYGKAFTQCLRKIEHLLSLMGNIHDCDVAILVLSDYLKEVKLYNRSMVDKKYRFSLRALQNILIGQTSMRNELFLELCTALKTLKRANFREALVRAIH